MVSHGTRLHVLLVLCIFHFEACSFRHTMSNATALKHNSSDLDHDTVGVAVSHAAKQAFNEHVNTTVSEARRSLVEAAEQPHPPLPLWQDRLLPASEDSGFWSTRYTVVREALVSCVMFAPLVLLGVCTSFGSSGDQGKLSNVFVKTSIHCGYAFVTGWANCIIALRYKLFATVMVGNSILMGLAVVCNVPTSATSLNINETTCLNVDSFDHYALAIATFMAGACVHGLVERSFGWSPRKLAPMVALGFLAAESLRMCLPGTKYELHILSATFGLATSISSNCGIGGMPWSGIATGNLVNIGYGCAGFAATDVNVKDVQEVFANICVFVSFLTGIALGVIFHSFQCLTFNGIALATLLHANVLICPPVKTKDDVLFEAIKQLSRKQKKSQKWAT